jgi:hypothetical protein
VIRLATSPRVTGFGSAAPATGVTNEPSPMPSTASTDLHDRERTTLRELDRAAALSERQGMKLYAACARRCQGELEGGDAGAARVAAADAWMRSENVWDPFRMAGVFATGTRRRG